ncbi:uncharacterized protein PHACADRAFT_259009 [Phanerochaete carnosa HHB-10118-sp]|uniref:Extracellular membrane protein CFEM domain-containing protein n=1 Tax=Phanerochaete carnosa (strain HHB-10118-sp) TaxID=650164 RepID=K5W7C5_PHACS|nr:uncharacterized protein PHACADRAFT_259009 [Phanerochaete carnosa HHB-10118-sp]EKM54854.1 hypothetical protein PHACADRAFT_259009 [Phanerochaete carnosa HHB-10118-sp]
MKQLPFEILLLTAANIVRANRGVYHRDATTPCAGDVEDLNVNGQSPGVVYDQLQEPCLQAVGTLSAPACKCNLPVYNIFMADVVCQQNSPESWALWAQTNQCNASEPPTSIPYDTGALDVPKWAYTNLANGQFDLASALKEARGWDPIQIATPIIVGVVVALLAAILFYFYRRRHRGASVGRQRKQKPWQNAHLHGPRRFFGLLPEYSTVRSRPSREPQWEIDDNVVLVDELSRTGLGSPESGHSRVESTASLLSATESRYSTRQRSFFDTLAAKFSNMSLHKKYQSGTIKGPDFKRVHVVPRSADAKFNLDGTDLTPPVSQNHVRALSDDDVLERRSTLPSVLDIRAPSTAGPQDRFALRNGPLPEENYSPTDYTPRTVFQSEYSLGTTDFMTPVSPPGSDAAPPMRDFAAARPVNVVNPRSPLLQSSGLNGSPQPRRDQSMYIELRESTDSLAHALYPRGAHAY